MVLSNNTSSGVGLLTWLLVGLASLVVGYGIYWITWRMLVLLRPHRPHEQRCLACGKQGNDLYLCDACGCSVCKRHVVMYHKGTEQELVKPNGRSAHYYRREHSLPQGYWCPVCDGKRLIAMTIGIVCGDVSFIASMEWFISRLS